MIKKLVLAGLAAFAVSAQAAPISFFDVQFDVTAVAQAEGQVGFDVQSGGAAATPVSASADSLGTTDIATAGAIGTDGVLTALASVSGEGDDVSLAVATSMFTGSFLGDGQLLLDIAFDATDSAVGSGFAASSLFVSLVSDGATLFADYVNGMQTLAYFLAPGALNVLTLTLSSEANVGFAAAATGNADAFGLVTFAGTVPTPATLLLVLLGGGLMLVFRPRAAGGAQA